STSRFWRQSRFRCSSTSGRRHSLASPSSPSARWSTPDSHDLAKFSRDAESSERSAVDASHCPALPFRQSIGRALPVKKQKKRPVATHFLNRRQQRKQSAFGFSVASV